MLDLTSLKKAILSLERAWNFASYRLKDDNIEQDEVEVLKAAVIQNFEFTYELSWKFMKRWLEVNYSETYTSGITRKQLFRLAAENILIEDFDNWVKYHESRNETSHTYEKETADEIFEVAGNFLVDAKKLLNVLEAHND